MTLRKSAKNRAIQLLNQSTKTAHCRWITIAILVILCYLPTWGIGIINGIWNGSAQSVLNFGFFGLGIQVFLQNQKTLRSWSVQKDDRVLGYLIIVMGIISFCFFHGIQKIISLQALSVMVIAAGIFLSTWGVQVFQKFPLSIGLFLVGIYPDIQLVLTRTCQFLTSPDLLECIMARLGSLGLSGIGYKATAQAAYILLPEGSVFVGSGCSGFHMAMVLTGMGVLIGRFMTLTWRKTFGLMLFGWALSLVLNIPRIMLMSIAAIHWGKDSFDFWHGPIGGQLFAGLLFTIYYYVVMWAIDRKSTSTSASKD